MAKPSNKRKDSFVLGLEIQDVLLRYEMCSTTSIVCYWQPVPCWAFDNAMCDISAQKTQKKTLQRLCQKYTLKADKKYYIQNANKYKLIIIIQSINVNSKSAW